MRYVDRTEHTAFNESERSIINTQYKLVIMWYQPLPILILCSQSKNSFITVLASNFVEESVEVRKLKAK